jgi:predicted enzyme related to lactoylglutathione lyase
MDGELSFFELGVGDVDRAREFYGSLFGWDFINEGGGASIETPNIPGGLHGNDPGASPYVFFRVGDLDAARARVRELGGEVGLVAEHRHEVIVLREVREDPLQHHRLLEPL